MFKQYGGLRAAIKTYWRDYGGWTDLIHSPLFHIGVLVTLAEALGFLLIEWRQLAVSIMPTILGFSLTAYAITFSLMGSKLHTALSQATDGIGRPLAYSVNATFFHNVFIQSLCLSFSIISSGTLIEDGINHLHFSEPLRSALISFENLSGEMLGTFLLVYAVILLFSAALAMFRLGRLAPFELSTGSPANDASDVQQQELPARELYGVRWTIIRFVARVLRVKG